MAVREIVVNQPDPLNEPRMAETIAFHKAGQKTKFINISVSGVEVVFGTLLTGYAMTKKPNLNHMLDILAVVIGVVLLYDGIKRTGYL